MIQNLKRKEKKKEKQTSFNSLPTLDEAQMKLGL